jgi:membrane fusion protein, multidrug efflux system
MRESGGRCGAGAVACSSRAGRRKHLPRMVVGLLMAAAGLARGQPTIDAARVVAHPVERKIELPGEFLPYQQTAIHAKIAGFVQTVLVDRGSHVQAGQLLAGMVAPEMEAQLAEARARVQVMESDVAEGEARVAGARSTYEKLRSASETPGAIAGNELIQARQQVEAEEARVKAAQSSVNAAQASAKAIQDTQAYLQVTAPFTGVITARYVHPGALAGAQTGPLFDVEQQDRLRLVVSVPERHAGSIPRGHKIAFTVPAYPGTAFSGVVARVSGTVDPATRTMPVELDVQNPQSRLAPGMYPDVTWPVLSRGSVLLVPPSAVAVTTERTFVNRIRDGVVEWVDVVKGAASGELIEVRGNLGSGDVVALRGTDELRPGAHVQVKVR